MGEVIQIYGSTVKIPDLPKDDFGLNYGLPRKEQKWKKQELPDFFETVEYDKGGNLILTPQQEKYADQEVKRCKNGIHIWIGERLRFLPKRYYFYLQYYTLEDGSSPDFREADRLWFLFHQFWFNILWCLFIIRTKKRRQGASSQACSNMLYEAIFFRNSNCGLISKTKEDSKDTFTQMITMAYRLLPVFLKPKQVNKEDSVTELVFAHKSQSVKAGIAAGAKEEEGHNSKINYRAPVLNAFDRGRLSYFLGDEFGKLAKEVPASQLLSIILKTFVKGVKRLGFGEFPSTVNEMTKGGGAEFKKMWDNANQFKRTPSLNRGARFFQPAYEAYEGFIDEFGDSVIDEPTEEQYEYLVNKWVVRNEDGVLISELSEEDIRLGAKVYVMNKRRDGLTGMDLEEEIRMNPCTEEEAFMYAGQGCEFNAPNFMKQIERLENNPAESYWRQCRLQEVVEEKTGRIIVKPVDDPKGDWWIGEFPDNANNYGKIGGLVEGRNKLLYQGGADTYRNIFADDGSEGVLCFTKKSNIVDGEEKGLKPVAFFVGRPKLIKQFNRQAFLGCLYYGCTINFEIDAGTWFYEDFTEWGGQRLLEWTPAIDPLKRGTTQIKPGTESASPFQLAKQLEVAKLFYDGDQLDGYNGNVHRVTYIPLLKDSLAYNHSERTPHHLTVAFMMSLLPMLGQTKPPVQESRRMTPIFPTYQVRKPA